MLPPLSDMPFKFRLRAVLILVVVVMITQIYFFQGANDTRRGYKKDPIRPQRTKRIEVKQKEVFRDVVTVKSPHSVVTGWDLPALNYSQKLKIIETIKTKDTASIEGNGANKAKKDLNQIVKDIDKKMKIHMHVKDYDDKESKVMEDSKQTGIIKKGGYETQDKPKYELRHQKNLTVIEYVPSIAPVTAVNCAAIAKQDAGETAKAKEYMKSHPKIPVPNEQFNKWSAYSERYICLKTITASTLIRRWLYFINLTAQEFPLKTNYEIVRILQALNGNNEIFGSVKNREPWRTDWVWDIHYNATVKDVVFQRLPIRHSPPPFNLIIHKGSLHGAFTRNFVQFMMETDVGQQFSEWCKDTARASEHYWNTLNFNTHIAVPGGFNGPDEEKEYHYWHSIIRAKHWKGYLDRKNSIETKQKLLISNHLMIVFTGVYQQQNMDVVMV
ncbi:unnamed protein product [Owenia fusiformis]|uniref:Uncharacterized protein n=1 Tax=Owenia fusiformis TaxID=6347 RepID=A0A8S4NWK6_OWEFU|nr:unnamed protein product [Owenia fusiformis]